MHVSIDQKFGVVLRATLNRFSMLAKPAATLKSSYAAGNMLHAGWKPKKLYFKCVERKLVPKMWQEAA